MRLNQDLIQRMIDGRGGASGGGSSLDPGLINGLATEMWTEENYVSKTFFNELFVIHKKTTTTVYDGDTVVSTTTDTSGTFAPNEIPSQEESTDEETGYRTVVVTEVDNIEAKKGLWTDFFLSALGLNGSGGGGGIGDVTWQALGDNTDTRQIASSHLTTALGSALAGYATQSWVTSQNYVTSSAISDMATKTWVNNQSFVNWTALGDTTTTQQIALSHLTTALSGYATQTWVTNNFSTPSTVATQMQTYAKILNGTITIGDTSITPITSVTGTFWGKSFTNGGTVNGTIKAGSNGGAIEQFHSVEMNSAGTLAGYGGFIDFHYYASGSTFDSTLDYTSRIIESEVGVISILAKNNNATNANKLAGLLVGDGYDGSYVQIGNIRIVYDSTNNALKVVKLVSGSEVAANFYATGSMSALGYGSGGGGGTGDVTWTNLADNTDTRQIALSHLTGALSGYATTSQLAGYVTLSTAQTISGLKTFSSGLRITGGTTSSADDGLSVVIQNQRYVGLILSNGASTTNTLTTELYIDTNNMNAHWYLNSGGSSYSLSHPKKNGTIAITSDLDNYVTLTTAQTISGTKTFSGGLWITGQSSDANDDGLAILIPNRTIVGAAFGNRFGSGDDAALAEIFINTTTKNTYWARYDGSSWKQICHPNKDGVIALTTDLGAYLPLVGGEMSGTITSSHIKPKTDNTLYIGDATHQYLVAYVGYLNSGTGRELVVASNDGDRDIYISTTHNIGIGLKTPTYKLHVAGTLYASGAATLDSTLSVTSNATIGGGITSNGLLVTGKMSSSSDDDGLRVLIPTASYAGLTFGNKSGATSDVVRGEIYVSIADKKSYWFLQAGTTGTQIEHPKKNGVIALVSDIPTNTSELTNDAGFITSSALVDYVTLATDQTISGAKTFSGGLRITGKIPSGDDDGLSVILQNQTYVGILLGNAIDSSATTTYTELYVNTSTKNAYWTIYSDGTFKQLIHPNKNGTIAVVSDLNDYVTLTTNQTISGLKTFSAGLAITGATSGSATDGLSISIDQRYIGVILSNGKSGANGVTAEFYVDSTTLGSYWYLNSGGSNYSLTHPKKNGTIAVVSDLDAYLPLAGGTMTGTINTSHLKPNGNTQQYIGDASHQYLVVYARYYNSGTNQPLAVASNDGDRDIYITSGHDIGIGLTAPSSKLHVNGTITANGNVVTDSSGGVFEGFSSWELNTHDTAGTNIGGFLDFHYNGTAQDYSVRLIEKDYSGVLQILAKDASTGNAQRAGLIVGAGTYTSFIQIGNGRIVWNDSDHALRIVDKDGNACNLYATGGISALGYQSGGGGGGSTGVFSTSITPDTTGVYDLGTSTYKWRNLYLASANGGNGFSIMTSYTGYVYMGAASSKIRIGATLDVLERISICAEANQGSAYDLYVSGDNDGNAYFGGNVSVYSLTQRSDVRYKDIIGDVALTIQQIASAPVFQFMFKEQRKNKRMLVGTSAQYWDAVMPEVVTRDADGMLGLDYGVTALVSTIILAKGMTEHERRITKLEMENAELRARIKDLEEN